MIYGLQDLAIETFRKLPPQDILFFYAIMAKEWNEGKSEHPLDKRYPISMLALINRIFP